MQDCNISSALAVEILQCCTKPSMFSCFLHYDSGVTILHVSDGIMENGRRWAHGTWSPSVRDTVGVDNTLVVNLILECGCILYHSQKRAVYPVKVGSINANDLATMGARASAAMVLTSFPRLLQYNSISTRSSSIQKLCILHPLKYWGEKNSVGCEINLCNNNTCESTIVCPSVTGSAQSAGSIAVTDGELKALLYHPREGEWPACGRESECERIVHCLEQLMEKSCAEAFLAPVDLSAFPVYAMTIEYPIDLSTIKARLESGWYR